MAGALSVGGTLNVSLINGFSPAAGQSFDILNWGSLSGTFAALSLPVLPGRAWNTSQLYTTGVLSVVVSAGIPGDYNNNGSVDAGDYLVWRKNQGTTNVLPNDPTGGTIGGAQFNAWRANFGKPPGSGAGDLLSEGASVPEPSTVMAGTILCLLAATTHRPTRRYATDPRAIVRTEHL